MEVVLNGNTVKVDDLRVKLSGGVPIGDDATFPQLRSKVIIEAKGEVSGYDLRPIKGGGQALVVKVNVDQGMIELVPPDPNLFDAVTPADFGAGPIPEGKLDDETQSWASQPHSSTRAPGRTICIHCGQQDDSAIHDGFVPATIESFAAIPEGVDPETGEVSAKAQLDEHIAGCVGCVTEAGALTEPCVEYLRLAKSLGISEEWGS